MSRITCKFGGTSLADASSIKNAAQIINSDPNRRFIVPSAPGKRSQDDKKITDLLLGWFHILEDGLDPIQPITIIRERFTTLKEELGCSINKDDLLDEIIAEIKTAHDKGQDVARVHSGDPSIYGAIAEQMRRLDSLGIEYDVTPGVPAFAAAAALLKRELTLPDISQSIVLTRTSVKATSMPKGETLDNFAKTGATLAIHLSVNNLKKVVKDLSPHYGDDCPVAVVFRASWPDEAYVLGTLSDIREKVKEAGFTRTALILVGQALGETDFTDSKLYDASHSHVLRPML
ncbi:MAG: hypothetical protein COA73_04935 [Candidatus Hydrogenedentota bacterium]|nr:MAG: hypothetical protein COA73_04935 [Candidatus Hydrogenedentota bacterium]